MKLSIIIPAFNAEEHILCCLNSLQNQKITPKDYEVIIVNDGSTDNTSQIVTNFAQNNPMNIHLEYQKNIGNGGARNKGVQISQGEYIYFLDADDYLAENTLHTIIELAEKNDLDIVGFNTKQVTNSNYYTSKNLTANFYNLPITTGITFLGTYNYEAEVWWYITKKTFYIKTGVTFYNRKFVQDSYITPTLFSKASKVIFMPYDVHRYRKSLNSITRKKSISHLKQHFTDLSFAVKKLHELRHKLIKEGVLNNNCITRLHVKQQRYVFILITRFIKSPLPIKQLRTMLKEFKSFEAYPLTKFMNSNTDYRSITYRLLTFIYNKEWLLYTLVKVYRMLKTVN